MALVRKIPILVLLLGLTFTLSRCGIPQCDNFDCPDGQSCILEDNVAKCSGESGGGGTNTGGNAEGESCTTTSDCDTGLACLPDLSGNDVCTPQ